jgi:predicted site-specific integrase-resolvase
MATLTDTLTPSEAARRAGVSESAIRLWLRAGKVAYTPTPLGRLVDARSLEAFIAERRQSQAG